MAEKILIVDDDEPNKRLMQAIFIAEGYDVITAEDGEEGLELFKTVNPDLVITDVNMPIMDGFELSKNIRKIKSAAAVPIVFISATYNDLAHRLKALKVGANDYISLPFNNEELNFKVKSLLKFKLLETSVKEMCKLSDAIEQSSAMVVITDVNRKIIYVNNMFINVTQYSREDILGNDFDYFRDSCLSRDNCNMFWDALKNNGYWLGELCEKKKNGDQYWVCASIDCMKNNEGQIINYIKIALDITEQKNREKELKKVKKI